MPEQFAFRSTFAHGGKPCSSNNVICAGTIVGKNRLHMQRTHAAVAAPEAPAAASTTGQPDEQIVKMYSRLQNGSDVRGIAVDGTRQPTRMKEAFGAEHLGSSSVHA